jgi:membrane dipeptidase
MRADAFALLPSVLGCLLAGASLACDRGTAPSEPPPVVQPERDLHEYADELAHRFIILDGHVDVPYRVTEMLQEGSPLPQLHAHADDGDFDYVRARAGGLDAPFMSIYTPAELQAQPGASKAFAEQSIDYIHGLAVDHPDKFALARTPVEVRANFEKGLISLAMGMENGSPLEAELANVEHFYKRGIRYITLTHSRDNLVCDSSYDTAHTHAGLSEFGRAVVAEMNRVGIMIDVSHVSDATFWQVMALSKVPVIASHSSCRHFTPGFERNMSDEMIVALAEHGGVIQINFGSAFLDSTYLETERQHGEQLGALLDEHDTHANTPAGQELIEAFEAAHPLPRVDVSVVADHIDHVVGLVGVDFVGFGSDFDGVGDSLPVGLEDVSMYPNLIAELLERGYGEADIEKICSGNVLRVWQAVEEHGAAHRGG